MLFPNKIIPFEQSVFSYMPQVLKIFEKQAIISPLTLYEKVEKKIPDISTFIDVLDCLYALGKINFDMERGLLFYVV